MVCVVLNSSTQTQRKQNGANLSMVSAQKNYDKQINSLNEDIGALKSKVSYKEFVDELKAKMELAEKNIDSFHAALDSSEKLFIESSNAQGRALGNLDNKHSAHNENVQAEISLLNDNVEHVESEITALCVHMRSLQCGLDIVKGLCEQTMELQKSQVMEKQFPTFWCFILWFITFGMVQKR